MKTPEFYPGCTRTPGLRHLHVDGVKNLSTLQRILDFGLALGFPSETLVVGSCVENHERTDVLSEEGHHEINAPGDHISTTLTEPFDVAQVCELVRFILGNFAGVTIELEHVFGKLDADGFVWHDPEVVEPVSLDLTGVKYISPQFLPVEYHHAVDLTSKADIDLSSFLTETLKRGVMVGTWYAFSRPGQLALRSNVFSETKGVQERVEREHSLFRKLCDSKGWEALPVRTVVEKVLGIWTSVG